MIERTDEETGELVRAWLQRYGVAIIVGIVLAIALIGGYEWWQNRQLVKTEQQSAQVLALNDAIKAGETDKADELYQKIAGDDELKSLAALLMASSHPEHAEQQMAYLRTAGESKDQLVAQSANWQLAQLQIGQEDYATAEKTLQSLKGSAYDQQIPLLLAVIAQKQGNDQGALDAYKDALIKNPESSAFIEAQIAALEGKMAVAAEPKE